MASGVMGRGSLAPVRFTAALAAVLPEAVPLSINGLLLSCSLITTASSSPFLIGSVKFTGCLFTSMVKFTLLLAAGGWKPTASSASLTVVAARSDFIKRTLLPSAISVFGVAGCPLTSRDTVADGILCS